MKEILKDELKVQKTRRPIIFKIEGITPLLTHNPESMSGEEAKLGKKNIPTPEAEAAAGLYINKDGDYFVRSVSFHNCIAAAAKGKRIGKISAPSIVWGNINIATEESVLINPKSDNPIKKYEIDKRRAVLGTGKNAKGIIRARPKFFPWGTYVRLEYDWESIDPKVILNLMQIGGDVVGIGDFRPEKKGPFGRFKVTGVYEDD